MIIYLDVYIVKNLFFNFLLLYLTSFLIRKKAKWYRLLLAALLGCVYAIVALYFKNIFHSTILKLGVGVLMLLITFGKREITYRMSTLFIIAYFVAGIIASLLHVQETIIMLFLAISACILFWLYHQINKKQEYYEMEAFFLGEEMELKAKLDTGNELRDSLFGEAVIVVSEEKAKKELNQELISIMKNERLKIPEQYQNRIKLISFQTIAEEGIKIGIRLDHVVIHLPDKNIENKAILILTNQKLKGYDALIGANLLENAYVCEEF